MNDAEIRVFACRTLSEMSALLGWKVSCQAVDMPGNGGFKLEAVCDDASPVIGRKGQGLEALELLLNRILKARHEDAPWVPVEVNGYSTGRTGEHPHNDGRREIGERNAGDAQMQECFTEIALNAAKEVRYWKEERRLGPYTPSQRRVIHNALKDSEFVITESIPAPEAGERMKYVVVKLK